MSNGTDKRTETQRIRERLHAQAERIVDLLRDGETKEAEMVALKLAMTIDAELDALVWAATSAATSEDTP